MIVFAGGNAYNLVREHKNGWNAEAFKERYSEVLERYDYVVGDWGYSQLRLRGFYQEGNPRATKESTIAGLVDYLNEYCNFGCAYFVLAKVDAKSLPPEALETAQTEAETAPGTVSSGETDAQTAETAASAATGNGILMRWPLKERPGGPVRIPGAAAVARAAQEAERRSQQAAAAKQAEAKSSGGGRPSSGGGPDKRYAGPGAQSAGQNERSGGRQGQGGRGPRPQGHDRSGGGASAKPGGQWRQPADGSRGGDSPRVNDGGQRPDAAKGGRWQDKKRRRSRFGGKPNRPESPHGDGASGKPGGSPE